jgi:hypothetical protein
MALSSLSENHRRAQFWLEQGRSRFRLGNRDGKLRDLGIVDEAGFVDVFVGEADVGDGNLLLIV